METEAIMPPVHPGEEELRQVEVLVGSGRLPVSDRGWPPDAVVHGAHVAQRRRPGRAGNAAMTWSRTRPGAVDLSMLNLDWVEQRPAEGSGT